MTPFDRPLLNPGRPEIAAALAEAAQLLGVTAWPPANLNALLLRCISEAHGAGSWVNQNQQGEGLALCWVSIALGPRLVRICKLEPGKTAPATLTPPHANWPAWALAYRSPANTKPELLHVCECGEIGRPAEIGWRDGRCGPCHDRVVDDVPRPEPLIRHTAPRSQAVQKRLIANIPLAVTPDGRQILFRVTSYSSTTLQIVEISSGSVEREVPVDEQVATAAFSADGTRLVLYSHTSHSLFLHRYPDLDMVNTIELSAQQESRPALAFSADGGIAYQCTRNDQLLRIDLVRERTPQPIPRETRTGIFSPGLACSLDGRWLAELRSDLSLFLHDLSTGIVAQVRDSVSSLEGQVVFTPDSKTLILVAHDRLMFFTVPALEPLGTMLLPIPYVYTCTLVGPWLVVLPELLFIPWRPLLEFIHREERKR
jgi:hypothetical protein